MSIALGKPAAKKELVGRIVQRSGLDDEVVTKVLRELQQLFFEELGPGGPGVIMIPGLLRAKRRLKPATKPRRSTNPFTKQPMDVPGRPAKLMLKIIPSKTLKDKTVGGKATTTVGSKATTTAGSKATSKN